jgi:hypothetical protein
VEHIEGAGQRAGALPLPPSEPPMNTRILVPLAFVALTFALGQVAGCSGSRPYGTPGVRLHAYLTHLAEE